MTLNCMGRNITAIHYNCILFIVFTMLNEEICQYLFDKYTFSKLASSYTHVFQMGNENLIFNASIPLIDSHRLVMYVYQ